MLGLFTCDVTSGPLVRERQFTPSPSLFTCDFTTGCSAGPLTTFTQWEKSWTSVLPQRESILKGIKCFFLNVKNCLFQRKSNFFVSPLLWSDNIHIDIIYEG